MLSHTPLAGYRLIFLVQADLCWVCLNRGWRSPRPAFWPWSFWHVMNLGSCHSSAQSPPLASSLTCPQGPCVLPRASYLTLPRLRHVYVSWAWASEPGPLNLLLELLSPRRPLPGLFSGFLLSFLKWPHRCLSPASGACLP